LVIVDDHHPPKSSVTGCTGAVARFPDPGSPALQVAADFWHRRSMRLLISDVC
jgi:hypothetical protein